MYSFTPFEHSIGIIDLGSNSARLIVVRYTPHLVFKITDEVSRRVRLSERMNEDNLLHASSMLRAFDTLDVFSAFCRTQGVKHIIPVATAAVRDATNGRAFIDQIHRDTGLKFRILTGEEEAYYGTLGVVNSLGLRTGLVIDIGGGSAEVSQVRDGHFVQGATSTLGALRLTEAFFSTDTASVDEISRLEKAVDDVFHVWPWMSLRSGELFVGVGGTIRALARIDRALSRYPLGLVHGYELRLRRLEKLIDRIRALPVSERAANIPGLSEDRADIILAGAVVVARAMRRAGARRLTVCGQGLREGLFYEEFLKSSSQMTIPDVRTFSVMNMTRMYGYAQGHTGHVAKLALSMFDQLKPQHGYGPQEREYLWAATMLHDIGTVIDYYDHHKHSAYIILGAGLPGFTHREVVIISQLCLYHRKGKPELSPYVSELKRGDAEMINRLASLLRLAEYLDRSRAEKVKELKMTVFGHQALLQAISDKPGEAQVEIWEARQNDDLFEQAFGLALEIEEA